jgi:hypothetical protein
MICFVQKNKYLDGFFMTCNKVLVEGEVYGVGDSLESQLHNRASSLLCDLAKSWERDGDKFTGFAMLQDFEDTMAEMKEIEEMDDAWSC